MPLRYPTQKLEDRFSPKGPTGPGSSTKSAGRRGSIGQVVTQRKEDLGKPVTSVGKVKPRGKDLETSKGGAKNANSKVTRTKAPKGYMSSSDGVVKI